MFKKYPTSKVDKHDLDFSDASIKQMIRIYIFPYIDQNVGNGR